MIHVFFWEEIYDSLTNFKMKKLIALFIAGLVVLSGCTWFQQPAEEKPEDTVMEEETVEDTQEPTEPDESEEPEDDTELEEEIENPPTAEAPVAEASGETAEVVLAKCITESGAKLYTASWCGHCKNQKDAFKKGSKYLDNTECAEEDGWADACTDAGVKAVPTWIFADGTVQTGNTPLSKLAELTDCTYNI